ncbi:MAG: hypothetical protein KDA44_14060 [Planctomycetales bacterium]|nr:hypothetical protein [Planctomycetales bacterium]
MTTRETPPRDDAAETRRLAARQRDIASTLHVEAAIGTATGMAAGVLASSVIWGLIVAYRFAQQSEPTVALTNALMFICSAAMLIAVTYLPAMLVCGLASWLLLGAARIMAIRLVPRWYPALIGGWAGGALALATPWWEYRAAASQMLPVALAWIAGCTLAGQLGATLFVERAISRSPHIAEAYSIRPPLRFNLRNLLGVTTVVALLAAAAGALQLGWRGAAIAAWIVAVQAAAIGGFAVWRRRRST